MEVRRQDKEMGMPVAYNHPPPKTDTSSSKIPANSLAGDQNTLLSDGDAVINTYRHQLNPQKGRDLDTDLAPTPAADRSTSQIPPGPTPPQPALVRYKECLKNHAVTVGGHVLDGCGEFMPNGEEGTPGALKCAACDCHRSFHRKETNGESQYVANNHYPVTSNRSLRENIPSLPQHRTANAPVMMTFGGSSGGGQAELSREDLMVYQTNATGQSSVSKKRRRTKFNQDQKNKMMEFAERLGWKIQKQDEEEVQQFCAQWGVQRQVFKVWMHNNKQAMKKKQNVSN